MEFVKHQIKITDEMMDESYRKCDHGLGVYSQNCVIADALVSIGLKRVRVTALDYNALVGDEPTGAIRLDPDVTKFIHQFDEWTMDRYHRPNAQVVTLRVPKILVEKLEPAIQD